MGACVHSRRHRRLASACVRPASGSGEGMAGLQTRSSRPRRGPHQVLQAMLEQMIALRRQRRTCRRIAAACNVALAIVGRWLSRHGLNRLAALQPAQPVLRYEHEAPGDLLHLDTSRSWGALTGQVTESRATGAPAYRVARVGNMCCVAIDDHSRLAFAQLAPDETADSAGRALLHALRHYRGPGCVSGACSPDNGACYRSRRSGRLLQRPGLKHGCTRPCTPRANGKVERFIQTALREWVHARSCDSSQRTGIRGCTNTTGTDRTPALATWPRSAGYHSL